ncbi:MAG: PTS sugar transporter subunit IIA [Phycisphaerales bacterium]
MRLEPLLDPGRVIVIDRASNRAEVLRALASAFCKASGDDGVGVGEEALVAGFEAREGVRSTALPDGVAFPHALLDGIHRTALAVALVRQGVDFDGNAKPRAGAACDLIFAMIGPAGNPIEHVRVLARLARLVHPESVRQRLRACKDAEALHREIITEDRSHVF